MDSLDHVLARLESSPAASYHAGGETASEPAALTALALLVHGRGGAAKTRLDWLADVQSPDGSVGIDAKQTMPGWPTGLAVLAWQAAQDSPSAGDRYAVALERGIDWMLHVQGVSIERGDWSGHDTSLRGWPWVEGTHSWLEPTAINLLALEHTGHATHPRANEAGRMLHDRLLPSGGCNYGNTVVFGQELRAHMQPTGMCLLALSGCSDRTPRIEASIGYLQCELSERTTTDSLCYALMGLAAWQRVPAGADQWLSKAAERVLGRDAASYKLALLTLAAMGRQCPLIPRSRAAAVPTRKRG
jgi:hypothetical protein